MCGRSFVSVIAAGGLALVLAELVPVAVAAEDVATAERPASALVATNPQPTPPSSAAAAPSPSAPDASASGAATPPSQSTAASPMPAADTGRPNRIARAVAQRSGK